MKRFKITLLTAFCCFAFDSYGQEWRKTFPDAEAAYTKLSCEVNIRWSDGKLSAVSSFEEDIQLATENAVKMMSRGRIYHSSFNELKKMGCSYSAGGKQETESSQCYNREQPPGLYFL